MGVSQWLGGGQRLPLCWAKPWQSQGCCRGQSWSRAGPGEGKEHPGEGPGPTAEEMPFLCLSATGGGKKPQGLQLEAQALPQISCEPWACGPRLWGRPPLGAGLGCVEDLGGDQRQPGELPQGHVLHDPPLCWGGCARGQAGSYGCCLPGLLTWPPPPNVLLSKLGCCGFAAWAVWWVRKGLGARSQRVVGNDSTSGW